MKMRSEFNAFGSFILGKEQRTFSIRRRIILEMVWRKMMMTTMMIMIILLLLLLTILVAAQSKEWNCSRSLAGIAVSNPAGGMGVCLL
jgi:hypothetical protein